MSIAKNIKWLYLVNILFLLLGLSLQQQETIQECGRTKCRAESAAKFKYKIGTVYRYQHNVNVSLNLGNASTSSNLYIGSVVELSFVTPCEADLRIIESNIAQRIRSKYEAEYPDRLEIEFKKNLKKYTLRFAFEDGRIKELCPHPDETTWSLNIKRGILSMLQNTMKRFDVDHHSDELDVNGICDTRYRLHQARKTSLIIMKTKDFNSCTNRGKHLSIIQSTGYQSPRKHSTNGLLDSHVNCEIVIDHNIYQSVLCKESHRVKALSNRDAAVKTSIDSSLILLREIDERGENGEERSFSSFYANEGQDEEEQEHDDDDDDDDAAIVRLDYNNIVPTNLLYDHSLETPREKPNRNELHTSWDLLNRMCLLASSGQLEQEFSQVYTKMIHSARLLDYSQLSILLTQAETICTGGRKHMLDALAFIGTGASLKVMRDNMLKKTVDNDRIEKWLTAIALVPRPDSSTVAALLPILQLEDDMPNNHVTLVYSAVVRAFCQNDEAINKWRRTSSFFQNGDCLAIEGTGIDRFLNKLEKTIEMGCAPRQHSINENVKSLEALKAIGNMGLETDTLLIKLETCIKNVGGFLPMEIQIAAIEAHRRLPSCRDTRDKIFLPLYRNVTFDPEIRIASYLQTMNCPDYNVIKIIKRTLKEEPVNQVGSFVWSHLTNLLTSSSPTRIEIQSLLNDRDLDNKFNSDARKYSRNYETSFFSEEYNIGGTFQSNVIFSSKSYIPRSLTFNISIDLFGESVQVLEATIRLEGMEYYAEKFFGPNGPLANEKITQHIVQFLRSLRSTDGTGNLWNDINRLPNVIDNNFDDPRLAISYKIFGNELNFIHLRGREEIVNTLIALDPWTKIQKLFSGKEIRYDNTAMFLDSSYIVASTSGLPVRLDLTGSVACNFKVSGHLNAEKFTENHQLQFIGNLAPSVSLDLTGKMTIDAFYKSSAVKIRSNAYSSSAVRLKLDIKGMELIRLNVELPNRKLEVFSVNTDILLVDGNGPMSSEKSAVTSLKHRPTYFANTTCSWPILERLIGLKFCIDYQFPNVTEITDASYILLNGPTFFRTYIIKADPSAQSYLFEYKWNVSPTDSILKIAFDTPGSTIHREASATLTFDAANRNVSLILRSAGNSLMAKGTYKRTDDEAMIDVGLNINGTKHLHGYMGYIRKRTTYGYTYNPKVYLGINGERIVQLQGTIRDIHKNNVSQCDIDLKFETKKVKSRVMGYIITKSTSINGNIKVEYDLQLTPKKETHKLQIEISLLNRSTKTLTHKEGNLIIQSSAYPQLNAIINSWYQHALGHFELHLDVNGKPHLRDDRHKLTAQLVLTHSRAYFQSEETKINAYFALTKPIQNLDIKIGIQKFSVGTATKTFILVRYAPGKEITLAVNLIMPRGSMFAIEAHANMTIPTLNSLIVAIKITERAKREYDIDFAGTWFSGHNATIRGTYADRSLSNFLVNNNNGAAATTPSRIANYVIKLLVRSPSLEKDILINCKLYRDLTDINLDFNVEYVDADKYALKFQHSEISSVRYISNAEIRYKHNVYAVHANIDMEREIRLEFNLDRWRDIHIVCTAINEEKNKEFGIEIKWDANRDPDLKFATLLQFTKHYEERQFAIESRNLTAYLMVTYPGRLFTTSALLALINGNNYIADVQIIWDPMSIVRLSIDIDFDPCNWHNYAKFNGQIITPFIDWKETSLNAKYNWTDNELLINANAHWHDNETVSIQLQANSSETYPGMHQYNVNCEFINTINNLGWITIDLNHKFGSNNSNHNNTCMDSELLVKYNPGKIINIKTFWLIEGAANIHDNITLMGNIRFTSPVVNYQSGDIKGQLRWQPNWTFEGASTVEIDLRKYSSTLKGDMQRIKESMIAFNVTTPLEKYHFITGRFGISERNRHIVAEIVSPSGPVGIEGLFQLFTNNNNNNNHDNSKDFNVMFKLSTPIDFIKRLLLIAKMTKTEADFRLAYNNMTAGFEAIWYYNNITDFHYSYIVYTPIHGLHESGIVAKLIIPDINNMNNNSSLYKRQYIIDTEFSVRIVESKVGIQAKTGPAYVSETLKILNEKHSSDEVERERDDDFNWHGNMAINLAIIEPITANVDVEKNDITYKIIGILEIPKGTIITINDKFFIDDVFHMNNILEITTPLSWAKKINSLYIFDVDMENSIYIMEMELNINKQMDIDVNNKNVSYWIESGLKGNYSYAEGDEDDSQYHRLELTIKTPLDYLKIINAIGIYESDENIYRSSIELKTDESTIYSNGTLELDNDNNFFDGIFYIAINSSVISIPMTKIGVKKDFTDMEKHIEAIIEMKNIKKSPCKIQIDWQIESKDNAQVSLNLETWIESLPFFEIDLSYINNITQNKNIQMNSRVKYYPDNEYKLSGNYEPSGIIDMNLITAPDNVTYIFEGKFDEKTGQLIGQLKNSQNNDIYHINGQLKVIDDNKGIDNAMRIEKIAIVLLHNRENNEEKHKIDVEIRRHNYGAKVIVNTDMMMMNNASIAFNYRNALNWDTSIETIIINPKDDKLLKYHLEVYTNVQVNGNTSVYVRVESPLQGLEHMETFGNLLIANDHGDTRIKHQLNNDHYYLTCGWRLAYMVDMFLQIDGGANDREAGFNIFYKSPKQQYYRSNIINTGFEVQVDGEHWRFGSNATIGINNNNNIDGILTIRLPPPNNDDHEFLITYHNNDEPRDIKYVAGYRAKKANTNYATDGSILIDKSHINAHVRLSWGTTSAQMVNNIFNATFLANQNIALKYALYTPKFINEETTVILFNYDGSDVERCIINTDIYYPSRNKIGTAHISYASLNNINGTLNATTSIPKISHAVCDFIVLTTLKRNKRFIEVTWSNESAMLNSDYSYNSEKLNSNLDGILHLEIPLSTRHVGHLDYGYKKRGETTVGLAKLIYNNNQILNGKYNCKGESRAGFEKETIGIILENPYQPLGIDYINKYEYSGGNGGTNYPTVESKWANIYRLDNSSAFNISGDSKIMTNHEGQIIQLQVKNFNKTVKLITDYKILSGEFDHNCRLDLDEDAWAIYRLNIINKTTELIDNQFITLDIAYPWRNFTIDGSYWITNNEFSTNGALSWNKTYPSDEESFGYDERQRKIGASLQWKNVSDNGYDKQEMSIKLKHPSLTKDAALITYLNRQIDKVSINATIAADYSEDPDKFAWLTTIIDQDDDNFGYSYSIQAQHPQTRLNLDVAGLMRKKSWYFFYTNHDALYSRSYFSAEKAKLSTLIDIPRRTVKFHRKSSDTTKHMELEYFPTYPIYRLNGSLINSNKLINATGSYYLNIPEKLTWLMVNYTPDAITSLRMYGYIPDARNAYFNIWRTYERDFEISDVSFYLKLNHSRLVTSTLKWRSTLKNDLIHHVKTTMYDLYKDMENDIVYWKKYIKSESISAINEIWDDAKDELHDFISDWENLEELNDDLDRLKIYLNNSYNCNDFYIKDLVNVGVYVLDELALRSHFQLLPNIFNEMWEIMGESGQAIRNSILWIVQAAKTAYKKLTEVITAILKGESITQIANIIEKMVEKYDKFIKDLHVSFIKYIENLWNKFSSAINQQWDRTLKTIEPLFIRVLHYLEAVLWKASKEILDFLYDRRNELMHSPYFDRFTNFTQDVDKLYKDIKANDIITNIRKYSTIIISFLRERYFTMVPFGKELKAIIDEILSEIGELKKLPTVHFTIEKIHYIYEKINYFYEYFGINGKIENAIRVIHTKLMDVRQSALQAENKYREAKTKFIFDPNIGLMCLEQKLPMPWHAFNQTPEFQEIPEYRSLIDFRNYFTTSNATFWILYYRYKPYLDPSNWIPPFKAQAMLVGTHHYVTYDGYHYDFNKSGSYLLTKDFVNDDFALIVKHNDHANHQIILLFSHQTIEIDMIQDTVRIENSTNDSLRLPMEFQNGMGFVYQKESIVTVELKGGMVKLRCNLKYDVCVLELAGWYFGKVAGLLGTMNNERSDDVIQSNGIVTNNIDDFTESWSLPITNQGIINNNTNAHDNSEVIIDQELLVFCENLFSNKSSEFGECFNVVEAAPYAEACFKVKSYANVCTLAIAYMQICGFYDTYLRIPDACTFCPINGGSILVPEGEFRKLEGTNVPASTDIVFIVEAKDCNTDIKLNRSISTLVNQINKELNDYGMKNNRWALVAFGGDGVYDMPRSFIIDNEIFTENTGKFMNYFDSIKIGNGNEDVFAAIAFASQLVFRAGVSKTFILMPCSHCESDNQSFDYSVINQVLLEHEITLHILMDGDFNFSKQRLNKIFYGLDATKSYTRKDVKALNGDVDLRRQVKLSKSALGYCTPLALESNGTIFSGNKLRLETGNVMKKFASVFAKRIAITARPSSCQHCECSADNDGVTHMDCLPCIYPLPASVDYVSETFNDDEMLSVLQPIDTDYGHIDGEED